MCAYVYMREIYEYEVVLVSTVRTFFHVDIGCSVGDLDLDIDVVIKE